jgi:hypothetical protein
MYALYCLFLVVTLALCQQPNQPPFKIAITTESPTVVAESDVWIKVSLTNTSNHDLEDSGSYFTGIDLNPNFRFEVRDEHGQLVPKRTYPQPELRTGYPVNRSISPGQTLAQEQRVSALYDMRKPGKYTIQLSRRASDNPNDGEIKSNIIIVTVTPKDEVPTRKSQQSNNPPFKIAITTQKTTVVSGEDVLVDVSLTNTSNQDVYEGAAYMTGINLDSTLRFEVRDEDGKLVPKRVYPNEEFRTGSVRFRTIPAGQTLTQTQPVSALYDMRKPGKYTVQVWRGNPDYDIKSDIVTVTVTPSDKVPTTSPTVITNLQTGQRAQEQRSAVFSLDNERQKAFREIQSDALKRLNQLADDASLIGDTSARSRLMARVANVLWSYDETRARLLLRFAFDRAIDIPKPDDDAKEKRLTCGLVRAEVTKILSEHDAKSASELILNSTDEACDYGPRNRASSEHPRSELSSSTALSVVTNDPELAYRLGSMSLQDGITSHIGELLNKLSAKDEKLAKQLLSDCLDRISRKDVNALEVLDVALFLFGDEISPDRNQRAQAKPEEKAEFKAAFATKLLNAALVATDRFVSKIERQQTKQGANERVSDPEIQQVWTSVADIKELAASYYSMLSDVQEGVRRYDSENLPRTQLLLERLGRWMDPVDRQHMLVFYDNGDTPESLVDEAVKTTNPGQRRELYELASQLAQQKGDETKALELAAKINDEDRRKYLSDGFRLSRSLQAADKQDFDQAQQLAETITRPEMRLRALIDIAERITPTNETRKKEAAALLDKAQVLLSTASPSPQQARTMMELARVYAQADKETAFNVTTKAIDMVNSSSGLPDPEKTRWQFAPSMTFSDSLSIFGTDTRLFETLAKIDYARTLSLTRRFSDPVLVLAAQLSVIRTHLPPVWN